MKDKIDQEAVKHIMKENIELKKRIKELEDGLVVWVNPSNLQFTDRSNHESV